MPECASPRTTASSPKSLSSVMRIRYSLWANARMSPSPGSSGQSPVQTTSWPAAFRSSRTVHEMQESRSSFTRPNQSAKVRLARALRGVERTQGRPECLQLPTRDKLLGSPPSYRPRRAFPRHARPPAAVHERSVCRRRFAGSPLCVLAVLVHPYRASRAFIEAPLAMTL